jgi:transcriptional regulator with XRE-family HTH domain
MELDSEKLKEARQRKMLTQAELAELAGTTEATVNRLEQGLQRPRISTVRKLAEALGLSAESLINWESREPEMGKAAA